MAVLIFSATIALLCYHPNSWGEESGGTETNLNKKQFGLAEETTLPYDDQSAKEAQENIRLQKIAPGMSLDEAKLVGGTFLYRIERDLKVWPDDISPLIVIDKQAVAPDESKIWLTFENATQFPGEGKQRFEVYFIRGKAQEIRKLRSDQPHPAEIVAEILRKQNAPASPNAEINESDYGTYVWLNPRDGSPMGVFFRLSKKDGKWVAESKEAGGDWKNISCDQGCEYRTSFDIEVQRYFPADWIANTDIACIQNMAQAFCRYTSKKNAAMQGHIMVTLVTGKPIPFVMQRVGESSIN